MTAWSGLHHLITTHAKIVLNVAPRPTSLMYVWCISPVEFEILLAKFTIKQINSLSYTELSEEYENDPWQIVSFGEKKL